MHVTMLLRPLLVLPVDSRPLLVRVNLSCRVSTVFMPGVSEGFGRGFVL